MINFIQFLLEANAAGSKFEKHITNNINDWLLLNDLQNIFQAKRFQTIHESKIERDEEYSDIQIINKHNNDTFFIECKEHVKDNIVSIMFDIDHNMNLIPVAGRFRKKIKNNEYAIMLANDITKTTEFQAFINFLTSSIKNIIPADLYFNKYDISDKKLLSLISAYNNKIIKNQSKINKIFDKKLIRKSTRNMLALGILWRLYDEQNTWDICHLNNIPYFGQLIKHHYLIDKMIPAYYIQLGDNLFMFDKNKNPLNIDCNVFPLETIGKYDLKFTPRFGTGSMYITPRSSILDDIMSNCSFLTENKYPQII